MCSIEVNEGRFSEIVGIIFFLAEQGGKWCQKCVFVCSIKVVGRRFLDRVGFFFVAEQGEN